jgi:hypothetical protein
MRFEAMSDNLRFFRAVSWRTSEVVQETVCYEDVGGMMEITHQHQQIAE